jgi:hypothetical protein
MLAGKIASLTASIGTSVAVPDIKRRILLERLTAQKMITLCHRTVN